MDQQKKLIIGLVSNIAGGANIKDAEAKIAEYESQGGFADALLSVLCDANVNTQFRQQSGIILKNVISKHWEPTDGRFVAPEMGNDEKNRIKHQILQSGVIADNDSKIRKTVALVVSILAEYDYPEKWPDLFPKLVSFLNESAKTKNASLLSGAVCCLRYFMEHICDIQIPTVLPQLFPMLLVIINEQSIPWDIREQALEIYDTVLQMTLDMRAAQRPLVTQLLKPRMPDWLKTLNDILNSHNDVTKNSADCFNSIPIKIKTITTLLYITKSYPSCLKTCLDTLLSSLWNTMMFSLNLWQFLAIMSASEQSQHESLKPLLASPFAQLGIMPDVGQNVEELYAQVIRLLDFSFQWLETILTHQKDWVRASINTKLTETCRILVRLLMLSHADCELFVSDSNEFAALEQDPQRGGNLRSSMTLFLELLLEFYPREGYKTLLLAAQELLKASDESRGKGLTWWWREREASVLVFGHLAATMTDIEYELDSSRAGFNVNEFVTQVLWRDISADAGGAPQQQQQQSKQFNEFLRARALWTLTEFLEILNFGPKHRDPQQTQQLINGVCNCLKPRQNGMNSNNGNNANNSNNNGMDAGCGTLVTSLGAVRCIGQLLDKNDKESRFEVEQIFRPMVCQVLPLLCHVMEGCQQTTLKIVLECMNQLLQISEDLISHGNVGNNGGILENLVPVLLKAWNEFNADESCLGAVEDIVHSLMQFPRCIHALRALSIPTTFVPILSHVSQVESGVLYSALRMLHMLVKVPKNALARLRASQGTQGTQGVAESKSPETSPVSEKDVEIGTEYVDHILPRVVRLVLESKDHDVMNAGCIVAADCVRIKPDYVLNMVLGGNGANGGNGAQGQGQGRKLMDGIFEMIAKLLDPRISDCAALQVGGLITTVIMSVGDKIDSTVLTQMLVTVIRRLALAELSQLRQSLVLIFARLIHMHGKFIIDFLADYQDTSGMGGNMGNMGRKGFLVVERRERNYDYKPNYRVSTQNFPQGFEPFVDGKESEAAQDNGNNIINNSNNNNVQSRLVRGQIHLLTYIMTQWVAVHEDLMFPYHKKVSLMGCCTLLKSGDERLGSIVCNGYKNIDVNAKRRTRSQDKRSDAGESREYTQMPLPSKLLLVILKTWGDLTGAMDTPSEESDDMDDDETGSQVSSMQEDIGEDEFNNNNNNSSNNSNKGGLGVLASLGAADDGDESSDEVWQPTDGDLMRYKEQQQDERNWLKNAIGDVMFGEDLGADDTIENCPEAENDPILELDANKYVRDFVKQYASQNKNGLQALAQHLNQDDRDLLLSIIEDSV